MEDLALLISPYSILTRVFDKTHSKKIVAEPQTRIINIVVGLVKYHLSRVIAYLKKLPVSPYVTSILKESSLGSLSKESVEMAIAASQIFSRNLTINEELRMEAEIIGSDIKEFEEVKKFISSDRTAAFYLRVCLATVASLAHEIRNGRSIEGEIENLKEEFDSLKSMMERGWVKVFLHVAPLVIESKVAAIKTFTIPYRKLDKEKTILDRMETLTPLAD